MNPKNICTISRFVLVIILSSFFAYSQTCPSGSPPCVNNQNPMTGHGAAKDLPASLGCNCPKKLF